MCRVAVPRLAHSPHHSQELADEREVITNEQRVNDTSWRKGRERRLSCHCTHTHVSVVLEEEEERLFSYPTICSCSRSSKLVEWSPTHSKDDTLSSNSNLFQFLLQLLYSCKDTVTTVPLANSFHISPADKQTDRLSSKIINLTIGERIFVVVATVIFAALSYQGSLKQCHFQKAATAKNQHK